MKRNFTKILAAFALLVFMAPSLVAWGQTRATVTDVMNQEWTGVTGTSYTEVTGLEGSASSAVYTVQCAGSNNSIQLRSNNNNSGIVSTASGGTVKKVTVTWQSSTSNGRTLNVYGKNTTYSAASDLYGNNAGTLIGTIVCGTSTELTITDSYEYIGMRSASGAMYLTTINVEWETGGSAPTVATPTFSPAAGAYTSAQSVTINCETENSTIYYTTDGSTPDNTSTQYNGAITVSETTTIKAIAYVGTDASSVASATYTIVNLEHAGTEADPYSVADARAAIDAGVGLSNVYATGIVKAIPYAYTQSNGITFNMVDDEEDTDFLQAYKCQGTEAPNVVVGDVAVVYGNLTKFGTTYEFAQGCQVVSLTHPAGTVLDPVFSLAAGGYSGTKSVEITCATEGATIYYTTNGTEPTNASTQYSGAISVSSNTTIKAIAYVGANYSEVVTASYLLLTDANTTVNTVAEALAFSSYPQNGVFVSGTVCTAPSSLISGGMLTYYISADGTETNRLQVYKGKNMDNTVFEAKDDIQVGDIVTVYGNVKIYNQEKEFDQGNYLVAFERPETPVAPVINAPATVTLAYNATSGEFEYSIENPVANKDLNATTDADWISEINVVEETVTFTTSENEGTEDRSATITLSYDGAEDVTVTVTQGHFVVDYAELPFEWEGGLPDNFNALNGTTLNSVGSYPNQTTYQMKLDDTGDYIQVKCNQQPGKVTFGVKMVGGNTSSTITVQGSADGETFSTVETFTISGAQNSEHSFETTNPFASTDKYVRLLFTKGANVGFGPLTIAISTNDPIIVLTNNTVELEYNETSGSFAYSITNPVTGVSLTASSEADWISDITVGTNAVTFTASENEGTDDRTATITLSYTGAASKDVTVTQGHYVAPFEPATYTLVTSTSLVSGKTYIIVGENDGDYYAMGEQRSSNRGGVAISVNGTTATVETADVHEFVITALDGDDAGYYSIEDGGYLYAASSGANQLKTEATLSDNGKWIIEINNGVFSIVANKSTNRNVMRFNYNNGSPIFACYATATQSPVRLYVKDETPVTETYTLTITGYTDVTEGTNNKGYYLIASPVTVDPATVEGMTTGDSDLYYFDDSQDDEWINYKADDNGAINNFNLVPGKGYLYAKKATTENPTYSFNLTGAPYTGTGEIPVAAGWSLIGNPYGVEAEISSDYYALTYESNELIATTAATHVAAMQGVFVNADEDDTVIFEAVENNTPGKGQNIALNVSKATRGASTIDRAIVRFDEGQQLPKFQLFENSTKLYIPQGNKDFAIVRSAAEGEMPVNFRASENGTYTIAVEAENVDMNYLHLIDNMTGADVDLLATPNYTFEARTNDYTSRFRLVFSAEENGASTGSATFAYFNGTSWTVSNTGDATLQVVDITGRIVSSETINGNATVSLNQPAGIYMLRLVNGNDVKVQKVVVR